jgi:hypothetical protein
MAAHSAHPIRFHLVGSLLISAALIAILIVVKYQIGCLVCEALMAPGEEIALLIRGGHGGTFTQEWLATILGFVVNSIAYTLVIVSARLVLSKNIADSQPKNDLRYRK